MSFMERLQSAMILKTPMYHPLESHITEHPHTRFYEAIRTGGKADIEKLVEEGFDVDHNECNHIPPLQYAILHERSESVQALLIHGAGVNVRNFKGETALHIAARLGLTQTVHLLMRYGADPELADQDGMTPVSLAATRRDKAMLKAMSTTEAALDGDADKFEAARQGHLHELALALYRPSERFERTEQYQTLMHLAVLSGNIKMVYYLLNKGLNIDAADSNGDTPLTLAAMYADRVDILHCLIGRHATLDHKNTQGASALSLALKYGHIEHAEALMDAGANLYGFDRLDTMLTLTHYGIESFPSHAEAYRQIEMRLLVKGVGVDVSTNHLRWTPLMQTCTQHQNPQTQEHLQLLINLGADINYADVNGRTGLMLAASMGRLKAVQRLLENYVEVDTTDHFGWTALMLSTYYNHTTIATTLLKNGADVNITSEKGLNALKIAKQHKRKELITLFMAFGAEEENPG